MCASFWITAAAAKRHRIALLFGTDATSLEPRDRNRLKVRVKQWILPAIFRMATVALAPSAATADYLRNLGVPDDRIVITPFVVDNDYWASRAAAVDRLAVRSAWGISDRRSIVLLFCAKLQPWKRPQDVLRAFAQANVPDAHLIIAGDGPLRAELEAEASRLKIAGRVQFLGFVNQSQLPALYRSADVMVLPSEYDPCPVVVCEAMLCGCPVILSDKIRGRLELVRSGDTGFIYPCGDVDALADTLQRALSDRHKLSQMSEAAGNRMKTWSPRENIEAHICAVKASAVPKRRNCSREAPDLQPRLRT